MPPRRLRTERIDELAEFMLSRGYSKLRPWIDATFSGKDVALELAEPIDFDWLSKNVELLYPLKVVPEENCIECEATWRTIRGG
jgi:hypothetical protein